MAKIPPGAFDYYISLGTARSYQAVADKFSASKRCVVKRATKERWQERAKMLEGKAREKADAAAVEQLGEMNERHLKMAHFVQTKALETLRTLPLTSALHAVRALDTAIRQERLIRGEPTEHTHTSVDERIRVEYQEWMRLAGEAAPVRTIEAVALTPDGRSGS